MFLYISTLREQRSYRPIHNGYHFLLTATSGCLFTCVREQTRFARINDRWGNPPSEPLFSRGRRWAPNHIRYPSQPRRLSTLIPSRATTGESGRVALLQGKIWYRVWTGWSTMLQVGYTIAPYQPTTYHDHQRQEIPLFGISIILSSLFFFETRLYWTAFRKTNFYIFLQFFR